MAIAVGTWLSAERSAMRVIVPSRSTRSTCSLLLSTTQRAEPAESVAMLYHEPSGSKSFSGGLATGLLRSQLLRSARRTGLPVVTS
jgi:hypothetical protein